MKVRIIKCTHINGWYGNKIGEIIEIISSPNMNKMGIYQVNDKLLFDNESLIKIEDCLTLDKHRESLITDIINGI